MTVGAHVRSAGVVARREAAGDFFSTPVPWLLLALGVVVVVALLIGLAAIYWGDEYAQPSWNAHSVPPPMLR